MTIETQSEALVLVSYGSQGVVLLANGERKRCKYRRKVGRPYCGDRVMVARADEASLVVEAVLPRRNYFVRTDERQRQNIIAANLDQVLIVVATRPLPSRDLMERYLLAVHSLGIEPLIVYNKTDLELDADEKANGVQVLAHMPDYEELGYTVIRTSCKTAPGISGLQTVLKDKTSILVGQSGVGKSSLINRLATDSDQKTAATSSKSGEGRHTTVNSVMIKLPEGGVVIDSPGVRDYAPALDTAEQAIKGFREIQSLGQQCRFANCKHLG